MKKIFFRLACLTLCLLLLTACGGKQGTLPEGGKTADTLWGKQVKYEIVDIPEDAIQNNSAKAIAMAPDGKHLLCRSFEDGPYLYDLETGRITKVTPGDAYTEEYLRERLQMISLLGKSAEEMEAYRAEHPELETASGAELLRLITVLGREGLLPTSFAAMTEGNYLVVFGNSAGITGAIDCDTGKLYQAPLRTTCVGVMGDQLICRQSPDSALTLRDIKTGREEEKDFSFAMPDAGYAPIQGAAPLPGGGLCAVIGGEADYDKGQPIVLGVLGPDGKQETYDLGLGYCFDSYTVVAPDENSVLVCSEARPYPSVYLIRRDTGAVSLLWFDGKGSQPELHSTPLAECLNADGMPDLSDKLNGSPMLFVAGKLCDGKTVLLFYSEANCPILLFRPETMEAAPLLQGSAYLSLLRTLTGNGYDRWFDFRADADHYYKLSVSDPG